MPLIQLILCKILHWQLHKVGKLKYHWCIILTYFITAHQTQGAYHRPKRPDYGTEGKPIALRANSYPIKISSGLSDLYHYDVDITSSSSNVIKEKREVVNEIIRKYKDTTFQGHVPAFDGKKNLYSRIRLPVGNGQGVVSKDFLLVHIDLTNTLSSLRSPQECIWFITSIRVIKPKICRPGPTLSMGWLRPWSWTETHKGQGWNLQLSYVCFVRRLVNDVMKFYSR